MYVYVQFYFQMRAFSFAFIYCAVLSFSSVESISENPLTEEAHHPFNTQYHSQGSLGQYKWAKFNIKYSFVPCFAQMNGALYISFSQNKLQYILS